MPEVTQAQQPGHVSGEAFQTIQDPITAPSNWVRMESAISLPDINVNLARFKEMTKPLLSASWLLIPFHQFKRRRKHRIGFNEFDVPGHPMPSQHR